MGVHKQHCIVADYEVVKLVFGILD